MSQFSLPWDDVEPSSSKPNCAASQAVAVDSSRRNEKAMQCRAAADSLEKHIPSKHESANRMLALPPSRKRLQEAGSQRQEAIRLQRLQAILRRLATMHETATIARELASITSRAALERALFERTAGSAISVLFESTTCEESRTDLATRLEREAQLLRIPGFFPTPPETARRFVRFADFGRATKLLEPSAGSGSLIEAARQSHPETQISYCEVNCFLLDILRAKYEGSKDVHFIGRDFLDIDSGSIDPHFDAILLNPPFERGQDIEHVLHAYRFLDPDGILAAIVSEGAFHRKDRKATDFRAFLISSKAEVAILPADAFKASGTAAKCRTIRIAGQS
jgi:predicted RNA methylase